MHGDKTLFSCGNRATSERGGWNHNDNRQFMIQRFSIAKSIRDFKIIIAITIPIKNYSKKIDDRFLFQIRSTIFRSESDPGFHFQIDPRLKTGSCNAFTEGPLHRDPIFVRKPDPDFHFKIDPRFSFFNRDPIFKL